MKNKLLKKAGYLIAGASLTGMLLFGSAYAKDNNPTEFTVTTHEYARVMHGETQHPLVSSKPVYLNIVAHDEDGIKSHYAFVESEKLKHAEIYSYGVGKISKDGKSSVIDLQLYWPNDKLKVKVTVEDKKGNTTTKTIDVLFD